MVDEGIYFIASPRRRTPIQFFGFEVGAVKTIARIDQRPQMGLTVSPDGRSILYTQYDRAGSELILVENFRWGSRLPIAPEER